MNLTVPCRKVLYYTGVDMLCLWSEGWANNGQLYPIASQYTGLINGKSSSGGNEIKNS